MTPYQKGLATREANLRNKQQNHAINSYRQALHRHLDRTSAAVKERHLMVSEDYFAIIKAISEYIKLVRGV
jgi:hypothetical protein